MTVTRASCRQQAATRKGAADIDVGVGVRAQDFLMPVEDVFSIAGRGTVVTGRVEQGVVKVGDEIEICGIKPTIKSTCTGLGTSGPSSFVSSLSACPHPCRPDQTRR